MTSKLGHAGRSARNLAEQPSLIRSTFDFATRAMTFWKAREVANVPEDRAALESDVEGTIEEILEKLAGEHLNFQNVTSRYGNVDHVVLSKEHGVFLIETKAHSGRVSVVDCRLRVNGKPPEKDFVAQTLRNTYWLIEEIRNVTGMEAGITPLIVFANASVDTGRPLKGIPITNKRSLLATIQQNGEPMPVPLWEAREQIAAILTGLPVAAAS